ncbi:AAA family ATPase [Pararobbsia silviterrae]|uniref:Adenylyl-sulfate kinase n=1 Tax=Pararobbsia silviterrae TaxID=1792498 RepID=A0A494XQT0_9BURK|nr:AAA family ATPase [Pararobbsia silviterrae]RKP51991.1 adenylyl-sulfate kinase [Pararobbsia silviterrae]
MLIVIGGLPGTGKTTLSRGIARGLGGVHLRIDSIEQAILRARGVDETPGTEGYAAAYAIAEDNLRLGLTIIADCVNPLGVTRDAWRDIGQRVGVPVIEVETICSDLVKHQRRVETRQADIAGQVLPTWKSVLAHEYEPWNRERIVIDTARQTVVQALGVLTELAASKKR